MIPKSVSRHTYKQAESPFEYKKLKKGEVESAVQFVSGDKSFVIVAHESRDLGKLKHLDHPEYRREMCHMRQLL